MRRLQISIRYKFLIVMAALLTVAIAAYLVLAVNLYHEDKSAYIYEGNATFVRTVASRTEAGLVSAIKTMKWIAINARSSSDPEKASPLTRSLFEEDADIVELRVYEVETPENPPRGLADTQFLTHLMKDDYLEPFDLEPAYWDRLAERDRIPPAALAGRKLIFRNATHGEGPLLWTAALWVKREGAPPRAVVAKLKLDRFLQVFSRSKVYDTYLVDGSGDLLAHENPELVRQRDNVAAKEGMASLLASEVPAGVREYDRPGGPVIVAHANLGVGNLIAVSEIPKDKAYLASKRLMEKSALFAILIAATSLLVSVLFSNRMTSSLKKLYGATEKVGRGDFQVRVAVDSRDEVGALAGAFNTMTGKINRLLEETKEKARMEKELETAQWVQENFLTSDDYEDDRVSVAVNFETATECGGDWCGHFLAGDKLIVLIGDATGHGVPAALITAAASSCCATLNRISEEHASFEFEAADIMDKLNAAVHQAGGGRIVMTFFTAIIDLKTGDVEYTNASHHSPLVWKASASEGRAPQRQDLTTLSGDPDPSLGQHARATFQTHRATLGPGDILFWYTDGITECRDESGREFGEGRLMRAFVANVAESPSTVKARLLEKTRAFCSEREQDDDQTMIIVRYKGTPDAKKARDHERLVS